jgi:hypothetical protein
MGRKSMSIPTEARTIHTTLGDLQEWYQLFEEYAAAGELNNEHFHEPHVGKPVSLERVVAELARFDDKRKDDATLGPLPTVEQMRAKLNGSAVASGEVHIAGRGSPCHNFWHWLRG